MSFMLQSHNPALTYDDISLVPAYSEIESRATIDLTTKITKNRSITIPIIASPMDTVCGAEMAIAMAKLGGIGCIHRFMSIDEQAQAVIDVLTGTTFYHPIMAAIGANGDYLERAQVLESSGAEIFLIDVAHGHHIHVKRAIEALKKTLPSHIEIVAGNIATGEGARDLEAWGADGIRAGIGGGSLCTTRVKTGFGVPNVSSLYDVIANTKLPVWACGGIRNSGDISKALGIGASAVVLGSLLAGTKESPGPVIERGNGLFKRYRGAASLETKVTHGQSKRNVEGESTVVPFKGAVKYVVEGLLDGVRSALSYAGSGDLENYHPNFVIVTGAGIAEAKPHLL